MRRMLPGLLVAAALLGGCATAYVQGATAYRQGRYDEAASRFAAVLAEDPDRLDALVGLGRARYKLGDWDAAVDALERAVVQAPGHATARLYLGLAYLQRGEEGRAEEHLSAFRSLQADPRTAAQVDRTLRLLRDAPLTSDLREFVAAALEDAAEWRREVQETRRALRDEQLRRLTDDRVIYVVPRCRC